MSPSLAGRRRSDKSRKAVLAAALDLCQEMDYAAVTVEAIASRAGVSKATIYRWWPSKGAVVLDAVDEVATAQAAYPDTGDIVADLHIQLTAMIAVLTPPHRSALVGLITDGMRDPHLATQIHEANRPYADRFKDRMRRAQQQGQIPADADLDVALDLVYGPLYHRLAYNYGMPDSERLRTLLEHALRALAPT